MDQIVSPTPAAISASVTLPRVLLKNELGGTGAAAGGCCWTAALLRPPSLLRSFPPSLLRSFGEASGEAGWVASTWRLAAESCVSFAFACGAGASAAAHGTAAAPNATVTHRARAAVRLINRLTCTSSCRWWDQVTEFNGVVSIRGAIAV